MMQHDDLSTERSGKIGSNVEALRAAVGAEFIRNIDLVEIKSHISRAWDEEVTALRDRLGRPTDDDGPRHREAWYRIIHLLPYSLTHVRVVPKRLPAVLADIGELDDRLEAAADAVTRMHERWLPVLELLEQVKPFVVKGRAPSTEPSDPRTLENTGTCSCCARNVKLRDLRIVDHGYEVRGGRVGQCFGVGFHPIEVSTEGLVALVKHLTSLREKKEKYLGRLDRDEVDTFRQGNFHKFTIIDRTNPRFTDARSWETRLVKSEIADLTNRIRTAKAAEEAWEPRLLPDGAGHFAMPTSDQDEEQEPGRAPRP